MKGVLGSTSVFTQNSQLLFVDLPREVIFFTFILLSLSVANPRELDLGFVVDSSDSVNWSEMKRFVTSMLASFDISQDRAHVGFVAFGDNASVSFAFDALQGASYTRGNVKQLINRISQLGGSERRVDLAFDKAYKDLFSDGGGTRMTARKVLKRRY